MFNFIPAIFGILIGFLLLIQRLGLLSKVSQKLEIIDNQRIIFSSLSILVLPFLFTYLYNLLFTSNLESSKSISSELLLEIIKSLFPIAAFILGRYFTLLDKSEDLLEVKESLFYEIYNNLDNIDGVIKLTNLPGYDPIKSGFFDKLDRGLWSDKAYIDNIKIIHKITPQKPQLIHDIYKFYKSLRLQENFSNQMLFDYLTLDLRPKMKQAMFEIDKDKSKILLSDMEKANFESLFNVDEQN